MNLHKDKRISIVISGRAAVGKTTLAASLANQFGLRLFNGGDILKGIAEKNGYVVTGNEWWDTPVSVRFMEDRKKNPNFDRNVDTQLIDIVNSGNVVITSHTLPWLTDTPIKFWLSASAMSRSQRMSKRDKILLEEAIKMVELRDHENKMIYKSIYGEKFGEDLGIFDFIINTEILTLDSLIKLCKEIIKHIFNI